MLNPSSLLDPSVPHEVVIEQAARHWKRVSLGEYVVSLALWRLRKDQAHRGVGFSRIQDYAEFLFDIPERLGSLFCDLGRHLERLPKTRAAMERGELTYTKVREFMRIATRENEEEWIEFAASHTNRELEAEVARARAEKEGKAYEDKKTVKVELNGKHVQAARKLREVMATEEGKPIPEAAVIPKLLEGVADGSVTIRSKGREDAEAAKPKTFGSILAIHLCPKCLFTWVPVARMNMEISPKEWVEAMRAGGEVVNLLPDLLCDCGDELHRRDECPRSGHVPGKPTGIPGKPTGKPTGSRHVPAEVWRKIEARDGYRCRVPGCGNPVFLEKGHMGHRFCEGAPNDALNVGLQCSVHNRQIETGALTVVGFAPYEKYYLRDGTFLGWGYDPEVFKPGVFEPEKHHVGGKGKREPPPLSTG